MPAGLFPIGAEDCSLARRQVNEAVLWMFPEPRRKFF